MKTKHFVLALVLLLSVSCVATADRQLDRAEILQIFEKLTNQPRRTWIPAGTIEAIHEEYKAPEITDLNEIDNRISERIQEYLNKPNKRELTESLQKMKLDAIPFNVRYRSSNEYTMNSTVLVRFDGDRFYWEINVNSRTDSVKPGTELEGNFMTEQFNLDWNARRIFAWDGENYTVYSLPTNNAIVDSTNNLPHHVNGPLTAGLIPWGYGRYTYDNLSVAVSSAMEKYVDSQKQIHLTFNNSDGSEMLFVLNAEEEYAVISHTVNEPDTITSKQYDNYQLVSGNLVPATILIERYDAWTRRLLASDFWELTLVSGDIPTIEKFSVEYETDALIEYYSYITDKPAMYRNSQTVDTDQLLAERLAFAATKDIQPQNCATAALKYVASRLGKDFTDQQLVQLINTPDKTTTLYAMKRFAEGTGFYCRAVKTDIQTLKDLSGCQVILHIPGKNHFIVLEGIDAGYVWSIDLSSDKFYYRTDIDFFGMDWTEGTALLISNRPIQLQGNSIEIADTELKNIIGGEGYTCTRLLQEELVIYCEYVSGECLGHFQYWWRRCGCEAAESGNCSTEKMLRYAESPCIVNFPYGCQITEEWTLFYMRSCGPWCD